MKMIPEINGLTVETVALNRIVKYMGSECPLIGRREILCEEDTSYNGCILDSWETYQTPVGVVERRYWARGGGLERSGTEWRIIPDEEIRAAQERYMTASADLELARAALEALCGAQKVVANLAL